MRATFCPFFRYASFTLCNTACDPLPSLSKRLRIYNTTITGFELA